MSVPAVMYVQSVTIRNFRSIQDETFELQPLSILVGKNNAGQSDLMRALRLLFEGTAKDFSPDDFYTDDQNIVLEAHLVNVEPFLCLSTDDRHRSKIQDDLVEGGLRLHKVVLPGAMAGKLEVYDPAAERFALKMGIDAALKQLLPEVTAVQDNHVFKICPPRRRPKGAFWMGSDDLRS